MGAPFLETHRFHAADHCNMLQQCPFREGTGLPNPYKIAAAVVLYNPTDEMLENIRLYADDVLTVYVIDNSEHKVNDVEKKLEILNHVRYIRNESNLGIARALNMAAELALENGYDFLLTMDQDSKVTPGMIDAMFRCMETSGDPLMIGIIAPVQVFMSHQSSRHIGNCEEILTTLTSGNILNLKAYQTVGPFLDTLFIDYVDHEYCLRLNDSKFRVIQANKAILHHSLGALKEKRLFLKRFAIGNHPPIRRYYATRNRFYLRSRYRKRFPRYFRSFFKYVIYELLTILLYETDKIEKLRMMWKGYRDYKVDHYGKYQQTKS